MEPVTRKLNPVLRKMTFEEMEQEVIDYHRSLSHEERLRLLEELRRETAELRGEDYNARLPQTFQKLSMDEMD